MSFLLSIHFLLLLSCCCGEKCEYAFLYIYIVLCSVLSSGTAYVIISLCGKAIAVIVSVFRFKGRDKLLHCLALDNERRSAGVQGSERPIGESVYFHRDKWAKLKGHNFSFVATLPGWFERELRFSWHFIQADRLELEDSDIID